VNGKGDRSAVVYRTATGENGKDLERHDDD